MIHGLYIGLFYFSAGISVCRYDEQSGRNVEQTLARILGNARKKNQKGMNVLSVQ